MITYNKKYNKLFCRNLKRSGFVKFDSRIDSRRELVAIKKGNVHGSVT